MNLFQHLQWLLCRGGGGHVFIQRGLRRTPGMSQLDSSRNFVSIRITVIFSALTATPLVTIFVFFSSATFWRTVFRARPPVYKLPPLLAANQHQKHPDMVDQISFFTSQNGKTAAEIHQYSNRPDTHQLYWKDPYEFSPATTRRRGDV